MAIIDAIAGGQTRPVPRQLADVSTDARTLTITALALVVGSLSTAAAWCLVKLIALVGKLVWFGHPAGTLPLIAEAHRSSWMVAAPVLGGLRSV